MAAWALSTVLVLAPEGAASAQEWVESPPPRVTPAPSNAFEMSVGLGYTQGFGMLESGVGLPQVVTPGYAVDLALGYRLDPRWALLWVGEYAELTAGRADRAYQFTAGLAVQYHMAPLSPVDPWVELGTGYRVLVENVPVGDNLTSSALQLVRGRVGLDLRPGEMISVGPVIGGDLNMFVYENVPQGSTFISNPRLSTYVFAGVQGRFDVGGRYPSIAPATASR
jgi:hypothetical protein